MFSILNLILLNCMPILCSKSRVGITCQWPILMLYLVSILNPMKNPNHAKTDKRRNQSLDHTRLKGKYQVKIPIRKEKGQEYIPISHDKHRCEDDLHLQPGYRVWSTSQSLYKKDIHVYGLDMGIQNHILECRLQKDKHLHLQSSGTVE